MVNYDFRKQRTPLAGIHTFSCQGRSFAKYCKKAEDEPLTINKWDVADVLKDCGVPEEKAQAFQEKYDEQFGSQTQLSAAAVVTPRQFNLRTPNVVIRVSPDRSDLVETRIIDGHPYILIRAEEGVEVNGVNVNITQ